MAKCIDLSLVTPSPPQIPSIFLGGIGLNLSFGTVGVTCCNYTLPTYNPVIPLPLIGPINAAIQVFNAALTAALPILDIALTIPKCPI